MAGRKEYHQFKYQEKLNAQSQAYGVENATTAYNRQRELTEDNALLQLQGMRNAGLNTAFSDGSSVGAASNVDQSATPPPGSAPVGLDISELLGRGIENLSQSADMAVKAANVASLNQDTLGKSIDNQFKGIQALASLDNLEEDTDSKSLKNAFQSMQNDIMQQFGFSQAQAQTTVDKNNAYMSGVQADNIDFKTFLDNVEQIHRIDNILANTEVSRETRKNLEKQRDVFAAQINAYNASAADSYSHVEVNKTQAGLNRANTSLVNSQQEGQELDNSFNRGTLESRKSLVIDAADIQNVEATISRLTREDVIKEAQRKSKSLGPQSVSDWCWRVANNWENESEWNRFKCYLGIITEAAAPAVGAFGAGIGAGLGAGVTGAFTPKPVKVGGFRK
mgnify:CR=1 FL=1